MKSYKEFREQSEELNEERGHQVIVVRKRGMGWEATYPAVDTTAGHGLDPIEAVKNLWNQPGTGDEDWEREDRLHRFRMNQNS